MKTLWINARFIDRPVTGVERVALELVRALVEHHLDNQGCLRLAGHRVEVKLIAPQNPEGAANPFEQLPLIRAGLFQGHLWEQLDLPRLTLGDGLLSLCNTGPLLKARHWLFLHDAQTFAIPDNFQPAFRLTYQLLFRLCGARARAVLVNSYFTRLELAHHAGLRLDKLQVCQLGSEHALRSKPKNLLAIERQLEPAGAVSSAQLPSEPYVLAFASGNANKNCGAIVQALEILGEDAPLCLVVGSASKTVFSRDDTDTKGLKLFGRVDEATLAALYRNATCLAFPSFYEGFGLPVLEAMAHGCPVVAADTGALPEVAGDAALYCDPEQPTTLAAAIRHLSEDEGLRQQLSFQGQERARQFSWEDTAHRLLVAVANGLEAKKQTTKPKRTLPPAPKHSAFANWRK